MSQENLEIVRSLYKKWESGDLRAAPETFDPQVEYARMGSADPAGRWRGVDAMGRAFREWLASWQDVRLRAERIIDLEDRVLVLARQTGRGRRSGVTLDHLQAEVISLRDGRIVRWDSYWDPDEAMRAVGLEE